MTSTQESSAVVQPARVHATVDFNSLLMGANALIAVLIVQGWASRGSNEYADVWTVVLGVMLCVQTTVVLLMERRSRDPFAVMLAFIMTVYFALRIYTLLLFPFSGVFDRFPYGVGDTNYALIFILIANLFLYAGLRAVRFDGDWAVEHAGWRATSSWRPLLLLFVAVVFGFLTVIIWTPEELPRGVGFLSLFISHDYIMLLVLSYFILFRRTFSTVAVVAVVVLLAAEIGLSILYGSRSALLATIQSIMLVIMAIAGRIRLRLNQLVVAMLLSPVVVLLAGAGFVIATQNRALKDTPSSFDVGQSIEFARIGVSALSDNNDLQVILPPIFARAGFFDFAAEVIAHRQEYSSIFTPETYFKSIVDNVLTPGFDVYDQPRVGNSLRFVYDAMGDPSKQVAEEFYQSDQLEIYGEFYGLLGYASLPLFFLVSWFLKRSYVRVRARNPFMFTMKRVVILFIWVEIINSFGVDWLVFEIFPLVFSIIVYQRLFGAAFSPEKRVSDASGTSAMTGGTEMAGA